MDKVNWNVPTEVNTHPHTPAYKHEKASDSLQCLQAFRRESRRLMFMKRALTFITFLKRCTQYPSVTSSTWVMQSRLTVFHQFKVVGWLDD